MSVGREKALNLLRYTGRVKNAPSLYDSFPLGRALVSVQRQAGYAELCIGIRLWDW